jgi:hypothetical protein
VQFGIVVGFGKTCEHEIVGILEERLGVAAIRVFLLP